MKLNCPECSTQFDVPNDMFNSGARRVRCSTCNHIWMQEAVDEAAFSKAFQFADDDLRVEPIPASLHPDMELPSVVDAEPKPGVFADIHWGYLGRMVGGFACGAALVVVMAYGFTKSTKPPIVVENVKAEIYKGSDVIHVSGQIANNAKQAMQIPDLEIIPVAEDGSEGEGQRLNLGQGVLDSGANMAFDSSLNVAPEVSASVRLRFLTH